MCYVVRNFLFRRRGGRHTKNLPPGTDRKEKNSDLTRRGNSDVLEHGPVIRVFVILCFSYRINLSRLSRLCSFALILSFCFRLFLPSPSPIRECQLSRLTTPTKERFLGKPSHSTRALGRVVGRPGIPEVWSYSGFRMVGKGLDWTCWYS